MINYIYTYGTTPDSILMLKLQLCSSSCHIIYLLQIEYSEKVYIQQVAIYETYNAGAVTRVAARDDSGLWVTLWTGRPQVIKSSRIFSPPIQVGGLKYCTMCTVSR